MPKKDPILTALEKQTKAIGELAKAVAKLNPPSLEVANGRYESLPPADNAEKVSTPLELLEITTGQLPPEQEVAVASDEVSREELERVLNINQTNVFGTTDFDTFKAKLNDMTYPSMQALAEKLQLNKFESPPILKKHLEESFFSRNAAAGAMNKMPKPFVRRPLNPSNPEERKAMEALGMKF
jgi:hypothetical protein